MPQPNTRDVLKAIMLDNNNAGGWTGGGGAVDHARARDWAKFLQSHLGRLLANNPTAQRAAFEQRYYGGSAPLQFSKTPTEAEINRHVNKMMGGRGITGQRPGVQVDSAGNIVSTGNPLNDLLIAAQREQDAAKQANIDRFDRGDMMYGQRTARTMKEVENWGQAGRDDINEQYLDMLNTGNAQRAARGLGNSTITDAFTDRNKREKERALRAHSEAVSDRKVRYDQALSKDHIDFVERRDDVGPDTAQIMQAAQMLGAGSAGYGQRGGIRTPYGIAQQASYFPGARTPVQVDSPSVAGVINGVQAMMPQAMPTVAAGPQRRTPEFYQNLRLNKNIERSKSRAGQRTGFGSINRIFNPNINYV